jgi:serine protease AprX
VVGNRRKNKATLLAIPDLMPNRNFLHQIRLNPAVHWLLTIYLVANLGTYQIKANQNPTLQKVWIFLDESQLAPAKMKPTQLSARARERSLVKGSKAYDNLSASQPGPAIASIITHNTEKIHFYSRALRAYSAEATPAQIKQLKHLPIVMEVQPVKMYRHAADPVEPAQAPLLLKESFPRSQYGATFNQLALLNIPAVHDSGYSGHGVRIAMIDAGFQKNHEVFQKIISENRLIAERDFIFDDNNVSDEIKEDTTKSGTQGNHGTSVWSVIGGYQPGVLIGAAWGAEYLLAKSERIGSESMVEEDQFVEAVEWAEAMGADIISASVAYRDFDNSADDYQFSDLNGKTTNSAKVINWAFERGMVAIISAGNEANNFPDDGGLLTPADAFGALAAGAVDTNKIIASFSSHGPTADGRIKPDLCAPGVGVYTATCSATDSYAYRSGTSFAAPLIAGCAALLIEKFPDAPPIYIANRLKQYASYADNPDQRYGWGIPDVARSLFSPAATAKQNQIVIFPNPSNEATTFFFRWTHAVPPTGDAELSVFNLLGESVWQQRLQPKTAGTDAILFWNQRNNFNHKVPTGAYFVIVKDGSNYLKGKFLVIH